MTHKEKQRRKVISQRKYRQSRKGRENCRQAILRNRLKHRQIIERAKARPCADCNTQFPSCAMDFDHGDNEKSFAIAKKYHCVSKQKLLNEIAKCDVVCANCHRIRTFNRWVSQGIRPSSVDI